MATTTADLTIFKWEGRDKRGVKLKGEQVARTQNLVRADLRRQGITPVRVYKKPKPLFGGAGHRVSAKDIAYFSRQLSTMLQSGVPLVSSLEIIAGGLANPRFQRMVNQIRGDVEAGGTLAEALGNHPVYFDELYCNLVSAGESAGALDELLESIATYKERVEQVKGKIKKALYYPASVIAVAIVVTAILLVFVIPQFEGIFASFGADLPAFTALVVGFSRSLRADGWMYITVFVILVMSLIYIKKRSPAFGHWMDRISLKIPVVGGIFEKAAIARFARSRARSQDFDGNSLHADSASTP